MALAILDDSVESIYDELVDKGLMDNSYFIFASDNGGCYAAGGKMDPFVVPRAHYLKEVLGLMHLFTVNYFLLIQVTLGIVDFTQD